MARHGLTDAAVRLLRESWRTTVDASDGIDNIVSILRSQLRAHLADIDRGGAYPKSSAACAWDCAMQLAALRLAEAVHADDAAPEGSTALAEALADYRAVRGLVAVKQVTAP